MNHFGSVFRNSCLKVPVDPISKMPRSSLERRKKHVTEQFSIASSSTCSVARPDVDTAKLKDFYRSIPDYNDINHLPEEEFYSTLKSLREKKRVMLGMAIDHIDCNGDIDKTLDALFMKTEYVTPCLTMNKDTKSKTKTLRRKSSSDSKDSINKNDVTKIPNACDYNMATKKTGTCLKRPTNKPILVDDAGKNLYEKDLKVTSLKSNLEKPKADRPKRNHSACSISWNDAKIELKTEIDQKFDDFFIGRKHLTVRSRDDDEFKTQSMPSSPLRTNRSRSPSRRRRSITIPKPFKMTER